MLHRGLRRLFPEALVLLAAVASYAYSQQAPGASNKTAPTLIVDGLGKGSVKVDGPWQFHTGDDKSWAKPTFDDSQWEQLTADKGWGLQGHRSYTGFAWYRRHTRITLTPGASTNLALLVPHIDDVYELYWNGMLVGRNGKMPPHPVWYRSQPAQTFGLGEAEAGVLAVRVWKAPLFSADSGAQGGFAGLPVLGNPEAIAGLKNTIDYDWLRSQQIYFGLISLYVLAGLFSFLTWLRDRSQWLLFWMTGFCFGPLGFLVLAGLRIPWSYSLASGLTQPCISVVVVSVWFVLLWLLQLHENKFLVRLTKIAALIDVSAMSLDGLLFVTDWTSPDLVRPVQLADAVLTAIYTPLLVLPLVLVAYAVIRRRRLDSAVWMVVTFGFLTLMIPAVSVAAAQGSRFTHWAFADRINAPLFTINGNPLNATGLAHTLLFIAIVYAVYRFSVENMRRKNALEQEFKSARELQQALIPEVLPPVPGFALTSSYRPAFEVGGDFFQIIPLEDSSTLILLGDVSGKGLKAAMTVSLIVGAARMLAEFSSNPAEILAGLNRRLFGRLQGGFATCIALRLQCDGSCLISCAGHPSPFLNDQEAIIPGALPLGLFPSAAYEEATLSLRPGDHLALYTDGLLEARSSSGELYSFDRLKTLFTARPTATQATDAAIAFGQDDDITVLIFTRLAAGEESILLRAAPALA